MEYTIPEFDGILDKEDHFPWVICGDDGMVALCSSKASECGICVGVTSVWDLVDERYSGEFQDALNKCINGGEVSVKFNASPSSGYELINIREIRLFSSFGAEIRLYSKKEEYLADLMDKNKKFGRVFDYVSDILHGRCGEFEDADFSDLFVPFGESLIQISRLSELILENNDDIFAGQVELCDISAVFDMIADHFTSDKENPISVRFENRLSGSVGIRNMSPQGFAGIVITAAIVTARLSENKACKLSLFYDGYSVVLETECKLNRNYRLYGRSNDFHNVYRCIPASPSELMLFEQAASVFDWNAEYSAGDDRRFSIRATFSRYVNADRLKYRDNFINVPEILREFSHYIQRTILPDTQKERED